MLITFPKKPWNYFSTTQVEPAYLVHNGENSHKIMYKILSSISYLHKIFKMGYIDALYKQTCK